MKRKQTFVVTQHAAKLELILFWHEIQSEKFLKYFNQRNFRQVENVTFFV